jgi:hypothetical protein
MICWTRPILVTALAEIYPSELVSPVPDFVPDPDDPFWEQESEDDAVTGGRDTSTGEATKVTKRKLGEVLLEALEVEGFVDIDSDVCNGRRSLCDQ